MNQPKENSKKNTSILPMLKNYIRLDHADLDLELQNG